jgi:hypothetical protein
VLLVSVEACDGDADADSRRKREESLLEGLPLKWSEVESSKANLPPGAARHFDLLHVDNLRVEADGEPIDPGAPIRFDVYPVPTAKYYRVSRTKYKVTLALTARDTDTAFYSTVVAFDLRWRDDVEEMQSALKVEGFKGPSNQLAAGP